MTRTIQEKWLIFLTNKLSTNRLCSIVDRKNVMRNIKQTCGTIHGVSHRCPVA